MICYLLVFSAEDVSLPLHTSATNWEELREIFSLARSVVPLQPKHYKAAAQCMDIMKAFDWLSNLDS